MNDNPTTYTTANPTEPVTLDSLEQIIRSLANAPTVTIVGGKSVERLMARLGFHKAKIENWLAGTDVHACHWLPDDFLLVEEDRQGEVRLFVYKLQRGELVAFEVLPGFGLYEVWRGIVGRFKRGQNTEAM